MTVNLQLILDLQLDNWEQRENIVQIYKLHPWYSKLLFQVLSKNLQSFNTVMWQLQNAAKHKVFCAVHYNTEEVTPRRDKAINSVF